MEQLLAHLVGDYCLQSDWMAGEKTQKSLAAWAHAFTYTLPFLFLTQSIGALTVILVTHFIIDRWRLARYVCYAKNFLAPRYAKDSNGAKWAWWHKWEDCKGTGYHKAKDVWLAVWLLIITDNTMHLLCNYAALRWLP